MASASENMHHKNTSNDEKIADEALQQEHVKTMDSLPDPDAGLSEEERAAQVCNHPGT